jgi:hypothetical protein
MSDRQNANIGTFPGVSETSLKELWDEEFQNLINLSYPAALKAINAGSVSDGGRNKQVGSTYRTVCLIHAYVNYLTNEHIKEEGEGGRVGWGVKLHFVRSLAR